MAMVLTAFITKFLTVLSSYAEEESVMLLGVPEEINKLQRRLTRLENVLIDAEDREITERAIKHWLKELRDFMYDAEDILEEYLLRTKTRSDNTSSSSLCWLPVSCIPISLFRHEIGRRIKNLNLRIDEISKDKENFSLSTIVINERNASMGVTGRRTSSLVEQGLVGMKIEEDTKCLVELLTKDDQCEEENIGVFAITGMAGIGKSTLARKIINNEILVSHFYPVPTGWVSVCQDFSEIDVLRTCVRVFSGNPGELTASKQDLEDKLCELVRNKRFFLVLDDVWDAKVWTELLNEPLRSCAKGSRVLVTTRDDAVAMGMQAVRRHRVEKLRDADGWALLSKSFVSEDDEQDLERLKDIGMEIVKKCDGLPLAIKAIAGVLIGKERNWETWTHVLQDSAWKLTGLLPDGVMGSLYLSYKNLKSHLKQCFLYLSLFPKSNLYQGVLARLWIAEGFIDENHSSLSPYELARQYWEELVERNILQPNPAYYKADGCILHDLFQSLAQHLAKDECFYGNVQSFSEIISSGRSKSLINPRRIYIVDREAKSIPESLRELKSLRSLLVQMPSISTLPRDVFKKLKSLRIIDFSGSSIEKLPESIGNLILLRFLELSQSHIKEIPESIGNLINLHSLILLKCKNLKRLPNSITLLKGLQNLNLDGTPIESMPKGIERLHKLRVLTGCVLSKNSESSDQHCTLEDMRSLSVLQHLCLHNLETVTSKDEAISASMRTKAKLRNLELYCTMNQDYQEEDIKRIQEVFEELCPPESLAGLIMDGYFGRAYPNWITKPSTFIPNLKRLELVNCKQCKELPSLGSLYFLDYLDITGASSVTEIGPEFFAVGNNTTCCFPKLTHLYFCDMTNWEEWSWINEDEARTLQFPPLKKLQKLVLNCCPKLRSLPEGLLSHCTALTDLALISTNRVEEVKNLYSVKHIVLIDCTSLIEVSNLTSLCRLMITRCRKLVVVERLDELQDLVLDDQEMETLPEWLLTTAGKEKFSRIQKMDIESNAQLLSRCLMNGPEWMKFSYIPLVRGYTPGITSYILYTKDPLSFDSKLPNVNAGNGGDGSDGGSGGNVCAGSSGGAGGGAGVSI